MVRASMNVIFNQTKMIRTISPKTVLGTGLVAVAMFFCACSSSVDGLSEGKGLDGYYDSSSDSRCSISPNRQESAGSGVVTAGEWNDLDHWYFWRNLMATQNDSTKYYTYPPYWHYNTANRIGVKLTGSDGRALINAEVQLRRGDSLLWSTRSDNQGRASTIKNRLRLLWNSVLCMSIPCLLRPPCKRIRSTSCHCLSWLPPTIGWNWLSWWMPRARWATKWLS